MLNSGFFNAAQRYIIQQRNVTSLLHDGPKLASLNFRTNRVAVSTPRFLHIPDRQNPQRIFYQQCHAKNERRLFNSAKSLQTNSQNSEEKIENKSFSEKAKDFWNGPNFKYWFIGVTAFSTWLFYYSIKSYKSTRLDIDLPPAIPGHPLVKRTEDTNDILRKIKQGGYWSGKVKLASLNGPTGCGKSLLAHFMAEKFIRELDWNPLWLPKSHINIFLNGDTLKSFHLSLQAFAAKLKVKPSEIKSKNTENDKDSSLRTKCQVILELIKEKLQKHPDWVMVIDNLQHGASEEVIDVIKNSLSQTEEQKSWNPFSPNENIVSWSRGIVLLTYDGGLFDDQTGIMQLKLDARLSEKDSIQLLKEITNIKDESFEASPSTKLLLSRIYHHPLSIVGVAMLLKHRLDKRELSSIDGEIMKLIKDITEHATEVSNSSFGGAKSGISESLIIAETVISMAAKLLIDTDTHLGYIFDLISTCAPRIPIPSSFINRYLRHPSLGLPPITPPQKQPSNLQQMFQPVAKQQGPVDETLDPKGKAWSNKNIAEHISNAKNRVAEFWQALKEVYDLYYGKQDFDVAVDDGLGMLRKCELILSSKIQPGDVDCFTMHPLVYAAVRQNFLASTIPKIEAKFLDEEGTRFELQPWYKKMSKFDARASIQRYRNEQQKMPTGEKDATVLLSRFNNAIIDVSSVLQDNIQLGGPEEILTDQDKLKHLQGHLDRVMHTLSEDTRVAKQNIGGKTAAKYLGVHGDYLHFNHPTEITGAQAKITGLLLLAKIASNIDNDVQKAISHVSSALELLKDIDKDNELETASILGQLAALHNSIDEQDKGKEYLERAIEIYESQRRKDGEYKKPLEFGKALGALGVIYGTLGDRRKSKELIERALMLQQTGAPDLSDEARSKHFGAEFASSLTDLGHAYVSLGMPLYGKKILDLSLMAHKNIHGDKHPEVVRTLTVLSIAHLMQGHNEESKKLRKEAGKIQAQVNALPAY